MSTSTIQAETLVPGDIICATDAIDIRVTALSGPIGGFLVVNYATSAGLVGCRLLVAGAKITVRRADANCSALCAEHNGGNCPGASCAYAPTQEAAAA